MTGGSARSRMLLGLSILCCHGDGRAQAPPRPSGTIAYTRGRELRVIEPDGSGDRLVWSAPAIADKPELSFSVTGPAWRPDGGELAFASDHEAAMSPYATDIYAVRPDGSGLRKITNAPAHAQLASYPKGTVTVTVQLGAVGPFFVHVQGAPEPKIVSRSGRLIFHDVADLGAAAQVVTATNGGHRWSGTPVDVVAGKTTDAGLLSVSAFGGVPGYGADAPFWRGGGTRIAYLGPLCLAAQVPATPPPGFVWSPLVAAKAPAGLCAIDAGPTPATADRLLLATVGFDTDGRSFVYLAREGATELPPPLLTFDRFRRISDLRWLPSGKGFVVARQDDLTDEDMNLHEYDLASRTLRQLTSFAFPDGKLRRFTLSPDAETIVFERAADLRAAPSDLWIVRRDGSGLRKLATNAGFPAWNPARR